MSKIKYMMTSLFIFFTATSIVGAATCGYEEQAKLNNEIGKIVVDYEVKTEVVETDDVPDAYLGTEEAQDFVLTNEYIQINILNLTENLYVEVTNDYNSDRLIFNYSDAKDGIVSFEWRNLDEVVNFTVVVRASSNTGCVGSTLWTINKTIPRYNDYSEYAICATIPDYYLCQRFVTSTRVPFGEFWDKVNKESAKVEEKRKEANKPWYQKIGDFIVNNKTIFIAGGVILVGSLGAVIIIRKRRSDGK